MYRTIGLEYFETVKTGEIALTSVSVQFPNISCLLVKFKSRENNSVNLYLSASSTGIVPNGVTDATTGVELAPGDDSGWIPVNNLNKFYGLASASNTSALTYLALI